MTTSSRPCVVKPLRLRAEVRLYGRQFSKTRPNSGGKIFLQSLNPDSLEVANTYVGPILAQEQPDQSFQFELVRYFAANRADHMAGTQPVFNRVTRLTDSWGK